MKESYLVAWTLKSSKHMGLVEREMENNLVNFLGEKFLLSKRRTLK
jgi:hypothetical protein